jgi:hypothetical protein
VLAGHLLLIVVVTAIPVALAVATATYSRASDEAAHQAAARHQVTATLVNDASASAGGVPRPGRALASWTGPGDVERQGLVPVAARAQAGSHVAVWVDGHGDLTTGPLTDGEASIRAVSYGIVTFTGICALAFGAHYGFGRMVDRSRMRAWDADWALVEPGWTREVS